MAAGRRKRQGAGGRVVSLPGGLAKEEKEEIGRKPGAEMTVEGERVVVQVVFGGGVASAL